MVPQTTSFYARTIRPSLGEEVFRPAPGRVVWLALLVALAAVGLATIARGIGGLPLAIALVLPIGVVYSGMAFVAHEALHGAVVRGTWLRHFVGWVGFLPVCIAPRHWVGWHNRMHHNHTGEAGVDPDAYPTLEEYRGNWRTRLADRLSFGGRRFLGLLTLFWGLNGQSLGVLLSAGPRGRYLSRRQYTFTVIETLAQLGVWLSMGAFLGWRAFVFGWLFPLAIANAVLMAHILTNHCLSPHLPVNDPLQNSLSVTAPRWVERFTLNFGLHVEHHLFPSVSSRFAPRIRELLLEKFPERYRSLPIHKALGRLFETGRIYKTSTTLVDPRTQVESPTV